MVDAVPGQPVYRYRAQCLRVIDGDSYLMRVDLGFRVSIDIPVRLQGLDCFERDTPEGARATAFVTDLFRRGAITVQSYKDARSFERWVCDVWVAGTSVAHALRFAGFEKQQR